MRFWLLFAPLLAVIGLFSIYLFGLDGETAPAGPSLLPASQRADRIVIEKAARRLMLYRDGKEIGRFAVRLGSSALGPKIQQGDGKTPEGSYRINRRNAHSAYHLSLGLDYPTKAQRNTARKRGISHPAL